jgi:hypothetical protein
MRLMAVGAGTATYMHTATVLSSAAFPTWLSVLAWVSLALGVGCAVAIVVDELRRPPRMSVMAFVWPLTALFGSVLWFGAYLQWGRGPRPGSDGSDGSDDAVGAKPWPVSVGIGTTHCGAGCALGDVVAEWLLVLAPALGVVVGHDWLFSDMMYAAWVADFVLAYAFGIAFQYFSIAPMRGLSLRAGLVAATKADTLSITAWQIGMYGTMAVVQLAVLPHAFGGRADVATPEFWFVMQGAMLVGFLTSCPANWWLTRAGIKERM